MKDISKFLCSTEECLEKVLKNINEYSRSELYQIIDRSEFLSIGTNISNFFSPAHHDELGHIYLPDQLDPEKITDYLIRTKGYKTEREYICALVCQTMKKKINEFYKEVKDSQKNRYIIFHTSNEKLRDKYKKELENRLKYPIKRLRGK